VAEIFEELLYGDQPAGWPIAGRKEIIRKLGRDDFLKYRGAHYVAPATTVVLAGKFEEKEALPKLEKAFAAMRLDKKFGKEKVKEEQSRPEIKVQFRQTDQTHLIVGCRAYDIFDERRYAADVLADILGGGMSSRLFEKVRNQLGAAYYVNAETAYYTDHGQFYVRAGLDNNRVRQVLEAILEEMKKLAQEPVPAEDLHRAKEHLSGNTILGLETSDAQAVFYGGQEILTKEIITIDELLQEIQAVTNQDIQRVSQDIFQNSKLNLALIGPSKEPGEFQPILHF